MLINSPGKQSLATHIKYKDYANLYEVDAKELLKNMSEVKWEAAKGNKGGIARYSAWYTKAGCNCPYKYGNIISHAKGFKANDMEPWMMKLAEKIKDIYGFDKPPDSLNLNRYDYGWQALGFHSDGENLFKGEQGKANIISLSLGSKRTFRLRECFESNESKYISVDLEEGDLVAMMDKTQIYYQHEICRSNSADKDQRGPRYNMTFRFMMNHEKGCPSN